ncbi:NADH oxidase [Fusarium odoratissimum]|uniref:NADH oxidase n=1 Tax=Fusarium oxysporum f. sp. cubense (strain race 4) TaxID=2502994 RepID=N1S9V3_FUSC4|nr:NADH oxidase [Fusarium odoratissimum]
MNSAANSQLRLRCGLVLKNRLVKTGMSEKMAQNLLPSANHRALYKRWAQGGWAALITGNIMVSDQYLGSNEDVAVTGTTSNLLKSWSQWTAVTKNQNCHMIAQLNHPGRQSSIGAGKRSIFAKTIAPSAIPIHLGDNTVAKLIGMLVFGTPRAMTRHEIDVVIAQFTEAARLAYQAGFQGVEVHAAHGFLLSQFMSSNSNQRDDEFGGSTDKRVELVLRIIRSIRKEVPKSFCVGVKINSADFKDEEGMAQMLRQIELIQQSFEDPQMMSTNSSLQPSSTRSRSIREGFFLRTSEEIRRRFPDLTLLVTGGFRSRNGIAGALDSNACDLIGLGRPAVKYPELPSQIMFSKGISDGEARFDVESAPGGGWLASKVRSVGAGAETVSSCPLIKANLYCHLRHVIP